MDGMKTDIHPQYYPKAKIRCACGNVFNVGATKEAMTVEICSNCHPFYTGRDMLLDAAGRVEKFRTRQEAAKAKSVVKKAVKRSPAKAEKKVASKTRKGQK